MELGMRRRASCESWSISNPRVCVWAADVKDANRWTHIEGLDHLSHYIPFAPLVLLTIVSHLTLTCEAQCKSPGKSSFFTQAQCIQLAILINHMVYG